MSDSYSGSDNLEVMADAVRYNAFLKSLVRKFSGNPVTALDFGAGIGTFTDALPLAPASIHCVEPDLEAQRILASQGYQVHDSLEAAGTQRFDYIFSLNVLEHIADDAQVARDLFDLLVPGGKLFIYVPAFNHLRTSMDDLVGHHRRYTRRGLIQLVQHAGFTVEEAGYTDFLGYFATLVFGLLDRFKDAPDGKINRPLLIVYDRIVFPVSQLLSVIFSRVMGKNVFIVASR